MAIQTQEKMSVADYLIWEAQQLERKHEYIDGDIIEMPGGTGEHSRIKMNLAGTLYNRVNLSSFIIYNSDMRVKAGATRYVYPDLSIVRGQPAYEDDNRLTLLNPVFVAEVTSPSSKAYDHADKLRFYLDVPSIEAYLIVEQEQPLVHLYSRGETDWTEQVFSRADDVIPLPMMNCELPLAQVYRGIAFADV